MSRRRVALTASVMGAALLGAIWFKHSHHDTPAADPPGAAAEGAKSGLAGQGAPSSAQPTALVEPPATAAQQASSPSAPTAVATANGPTPAPARDDRLAAVGQGQGADDGSDGAHGSAKAHARPAPFTNGPVHHGNVLRLKMDGPVESIEGAQEPTGFVVKLPGRRSLEAAAPLAARDSRIASMKVTNGSGGAELSVTFKESVPNYRVSARGDSIVIALAPIGPLEAADTGVATRSARSVHGATRAAHRTERPER